ncbi:hypothetical protein MANES_09G117801v8 [Manihot esculenta]|uniref:Uncharacterized protein n=1 Tax=Manihot esculenta TaxID=3983 RepID=A0ACB7H6M6_MANES|nr:hypothetical protein MANES_09G117801v8 [Manihot esculenta]
MLALMETHVSGSQADNICQKLKFDHWIRIETFDFSGGNWICWNDNGFVMDILATHPQIVTCKVTSFEGIPWIISFVYGSPNNALRCYLWKDLKIIDMDAREEWVVLGDFNVVISEEEQAGYRSFNATGSRDFQNWFFDSTLIDIGFEGIPFTWSRGNEASDYKMARLDRGICSSNWRMRFSDTRIIHPPKFHLDYCPLVLEVTKQMSVRSDFFRCQATWFAHPRFLTSIWSLWSQSNGLWQNLDLLQKGFKKWNKEDFW